MYVCKKCDTRVGTHGRSGNPKGTPADAELRALRMECHKHFDRFWKSGEVSRSHCYDWLAEKMELPKEKAHIAMFNKEQCRKLMRLLPI